MMLRARASGDSHSKLGSVEPAAFHQLMECEIFISMLVKIADGYNPVWQRALALEVLRSICSDTTTMRYASVVADS